MAKLIIGLTGGIGSGKTTIANQFANLGIDIIDADIVARQVVAKGSPALAQIAEHFGSAYLTEQQELDRAKLRAKIFSDLDAKHWLNNLLHPIIRQHIERQIAQASSPYCMLVAPLLIENQLDSKVDRILVVDVPVETQQQRTINRDQVDATQVDAIIASQLPRAQRLLRADDIIDNSSSDFASITQQVEKLHQKYLILAKNK